MPFTIAIRPTQTNKNNEIYKEEGRGDEVVIDQQQAMSNNSGNKKKKEKASSSNAPKEDPAITEIKKNSKFRVFCEPIVYSEAQLAAVPALKEEFDAPLPEWVDDAMVLRFLRQKKFDVDSAAEALTNHIAFVENTPIWEDAAHRGDARVPRRHRLRPATARLLWSTDHLRAAAPHQSGAPHQPGRGRAGLSRHGPRLHRDLQAIRH
jgi:hypothetical protein